MSNALEKKIACIQPRTERMFLIDDALDRDWNWKIFLDYILEGRRGRCVCVCEWVWGGGGCTDGGGNLRKIIQTSP